MNANNLGSSNNLGLDIFEKQLTSSGKKFFSNMVSKTEEIKSIVEKSFTSESESNEQIKKDDEIIFHPSQSSQDNDTHNTFVSFFSKKYQSESDYLDVNNNIKNENNYRIIEYKKGDKKTRELEINTDKKNIGFGASGKVHTTVRDSSVVIKKSTQSRFDLISICNKHAFINEFEIGKKLKNNPIFVKHYNLYIKKYDKKKQIYKLEMEKVKGKTVSKKYENNLPKEDFIKINHQLMDCMIFLMENKIAWSDVNLENIILDDNSNIRLVDFGLYEEVDNNEILFKKIVLEYLNIFSRLKSVSGQEVADKSYSLYYQFINLDMKYCSDIKEGILSNVTKSTMESMVSELKNLMEQDFL